MTRRVALAPVAALLVVAPWMAEVAWGGIPPTEGLLLVLFLGPLYGGAALLIRDWARRTHRGWTSILLLGAAFGLLQCGVVDQSLFNPTYARFDFQHPVHVPGLDLSAVYLVSFVTGHAIMSIGVPTALVDSAARRTGPWLGRVGTVVVAALYVCASVVNHVEIRTDEGFQARPVQTLAAAVGVVLLVVAGHRVTPRPSQPRPPVPGRVPPVWTLVVAGALGYLCYQPVFTAIGLLVAAVVFGTAWFALRTLAARPGWSPAHVCALAAGVALTHVVTAFPVDPYLPIDPRTELVHDTITATCTAAIVAAAVIGLRRRASDRARAAGSAPVDPPTHQARLP